MDQQPFCSYCTCFACREGHEGLYHAETEKGDWICDVCYTYEQCLRTNKTVCEGACEHRPKLTSVWILYEV